MPTYTEARQLFANELLLFKENMPWWDWLWELMLATPAKLHTYHPFQIENLRLAMERSVFDIAPERNPSDTVVTRRIMLPLDELMRRIHCSAWSDNAPGIDRPLRENQFILSAVFYDLEPRTESLINQLWHIVSAWTPPDDRENPWTGYMESDDPDQRSPNELKTILGKLLLQSIAYRAPNDVIAAFIGTMKNNPDELYLAALGEALDIYALGGRFAAYQRAGYFEHHNPDAVDLILSGISTMHPAHRVVILHRVMRAINDPTLTWSSGQTIQIEGIKDAWNTALDDVRTSRIPAECCRSISQLDRLQKVLPDALMILAPGVLNDLFQQQFHPTVFYTELVDNLRTVLTDRRLHEAFLNYLETSSHPEAFLFLREICEEKALITSLFCSMTPRMKIKVMAACLLEKNHDSRAATSSDTGIADILFQSGVYQALFSVHINPATRKLATLFRTSPDFWDQFKITSEVLFANEICFSQWNVHKTPAIELNQADVIRYIIESRPTDVQLIRNLFTLKSPESGSNLLLSVFCSRQLSDEGIRAVLTVFSRLHSRDQYRFLDETNRFNMTARGVSVGKSWQDRLPKAPVSVKKKVSFANTQHDENPSDTCQPSP